MSKYQVRVRETREITYDDACELLVNFLEQEYDALTNQVALYEVQYAKEAREYLRHDIEDTKKTMAGIEAVLDYYKIPM